MLRTLSAALAVVAAVVLVPAAATAADAPAVAWSVRTADNDQGTGRPNFAYELEPGTTLHDTMIVTNTGTDSLTLSVYAADAFTTATGDLDILAAGEPSKDGGSWITPDVSSITIHSGEAVDVGFTIAVPKDARPGDHPAGLVTSLTSKTNETVAVDRRLGTRINLRVPGELTPAVSVSDVTVSYEPTWNPFDTGKATISYALTNTGNTRVTATDATTISSLLGIGATSIAGSDVPEIMPGSTIVVQREASFFSLGTADATLTVSPAGVGIGGGTIAPSVVSVSVAALPVGLYLLLGIVLLIGALITVIVVRAVRRSARH